MELAMSKSPSNIINKKVILLFTCIAFCLSGCEEKYTSPQEDNPEEWTWTDIGGGTDNGLEAVVPEVGAITSGKFENLMIQSKHTTSYCLSGSATGDLTLEGCDVTDNFQRWTFNEDNGSIANSQTKMCMQSEGAEDGSTLDAAFCNGADEQVWDFTNSIISQISNEVNYAFDLNREELTIILWTQHGNLNQQWNIIDVLKSEIVVEEIQFSEQLLVSQAKTDLCSVLNAADEVVMEVCDSTNNRHLWTYNDKGTLTNKNAGLCMNKSGNSLAALTCDGSATQIWQYEDNIFTQSGVSFDVNREALSMILWATHGNNNQKWLIPSHATAFIEALGEMSITYPITDATDYKAIVYKDILNRLTPNSTAYPYPRDNTSFPGTVLKDTARVTKTVQVNRAFSEVDMTQWRARTNWVSTGLYAAANDVITLTVTTNDPAEIENLAVIINTHTDVLALGTGNAETQLKRPPNVSSRIPLTAGLNKVRSQYGGLIVIDSGTTSVDATVSIDIANAVAVPYFILEENSNNDWAAMQALDAPWGILETAHITLNISKASIGAVTDPVALLTYYDEGVLLIKDLSGFEVGAIAGPHQAPSLRERMVDDVQITYGFAHAGYPVMTSPGWNTVEQHTAADGGWGNWHEVGHNFQQMCQWGAAFGPETTNNIFPLYYQDINNIESRVVSDNRFTIALRKISAKNGSLTNYLADTDDWDRLVFLMQIKLAFEGTAENQGWDIYRQLQRAYRELTAAEDASVCSSDQASYDKTYELLSIITAHDLKEHFQTWGITLSAASLASVSALNLPLPTMDISSINPE
jgi:hypothetical protein|tara:strand:- start:9635 stop:12058 length:2424 start_codon:yes stop_codon:yes gene_type:complete